MKRTFAVHWQYAAATHTGWFRTLNEDRSLVRIGVTDGGKPYAFAVMADGMGGSDDGGLASQTAVDEAMRWGADRLAAGLEAPDRWRLLEMELRQLYAHIHSLLKQSGQRLGTTLTTLILSEHSYIIAHVGDCRVLRFSASGRTHQLSRDHTWVRARRLHLLLAGSSAASHPKRHVLTRSLGLSGQPPAMDYRTGVYGRRDVFLLSSDGFHNRLSPGVVLAALRRAQPEHDGLQPVCDRLLELALRKRTDDNVSLIMLRPVAASLSLRRWLTLAAGHGWRRLKNISELIPVFRRK